MRPSTVRAVSCFLLFDAARARSDGASASNPPSATRDRTSSPFPSGKHLESPPEPWGSFPALAWSERPFTAVEQAKRALHARLHAPRLFHH